MIIQSKEGYTETKVSAQTLMIATKASSAFMGYYETMKSFFELNLPLARPRRHVLSSQRSCF